MSFFDEIHGGGGRSYFTVVGITRCRTHAYHIIVQVEYMYVACCCCAAAADVDIPCSAYPLAALSLLRPGLILPYLHISPIAGIRGAAAGISPPRYIYYHV